MPPNDPVPIRFVDLNVRDLDRSLDFYTRHLELTVIATPHRDDAERWLDAGPTVLRLHHRPDGTAPGWVADDLQRGFRHLGFGVANVDERVEALHEAKVPFHLEPLDADGGVRISFFYDPDGVLLEFIEGNLHYHRVWDDELAVRLQARPAPPRPTFDHVALTASDQAKTIEFYRSALGYRVSGQLFQTGDPRGFEITYLHAGDTVLELFTFRAPTLTSPWNAAETTIGFRHVGFVDDGPVRTIAEGESAAEHQEAAAGDIAARLTSRGATVVGAAACVLLDPDGLALRIESGSEG